MSDEEPEYEEGHLKFLAKILDDAQRSYTNHHRHCQQIGKRFKGQPDVLVHHLGPFMNAILLRFKTEDFIDRLVSFLVRLATFDGNGGGWIDCITRDIIEYCLAKENCANKGIRVRVCHVIGELLKNMNENYEIEEDLWQNLERVLCLRTKDKIPQVRRMAAFAIHRLCDSSLDVCPAMEALRSMMAHDSNKDCRKEALISIELCTRTVKDILNRCRDISDDVRVAAFERLHHVDLAALSIRQRVRMLKSGLSERSTAVKSACSKVLIERWLPKRNNDIIKLLILLDVESYEMEAEIILCHVLGTHCTLNADDPPYLDIGSSGGMIDNERVFYWRVLIEYFAKQKPRMQQEIEDLMPDTINFVKLFENNIHSSFICEQLLQLARYLNISDEFSRNALTSTAIHLLKSKEIDHNLIPYIMKLLRKLHSTDEEEYTRLIVETVSDIKDPIEEQGIADDEHVHSGSDEHDEHGHIETYDEKYNYLHTKHLNMKRERMEILKNQRQSQLMINMDVTAVVNENDFDEELEKLDKNILQMDEMLMDMEENNKYKWLRILKIFIDLLQFTTKDWNHPLIQPLFEITIVPIVCDPDSSIRAFGLKAFSLYLQLEKSMAEKNLPLFVEVLKGNGPASELFALQAMFDFLMLFDFQENKALIEQMREFLEVEDEILLSCAVEGFTKLLFMNRLKHCRLEILSSLLSLYFNPATDDCLRIRQILNVFFPCFVDPDIFPNNKKYIARCMLPCVRTLCLFPCTLDFNINKLTDYILWLLDFQSNKKSNKILYYPTLMYDIIFEMSANPANEQIKVLARILNNLQMDDQNIQNLLHFQILANDERLRTEIKNKPAIKYLTKYENKLKAMVDGHALANDEQSILNDEQLQKLEEWRMQRIAEVHMEHEEYAAIEEEDESEDNEEDDESGIIDDDIIEESDKKSKKRLRRHHIQNQSMIADECDEYSNDNFLDGDMYEMDRKSKKNKKRKRAAKKSRKIRRKRMHDINENMTNPQPLKRRKISKSDEHMLMDINSDECEFDAGVEVEEVRSSEMKDDKNTNGLRRSNRLLNKNGSGSSEIEHQKLPAKKERKKKQSIESNVNVDVSIDDESEDESFVADDDIGDIVNIPHRRRKNRVHARMAETHEMMNSPEVEESSDELEDMDVNIENFDRILIEIEKELETSVEDEELDI